MFIMLLALAFLAQPESRVHPWEAWKIVRISHDIERAFRLPDALIAAVVLAESGGRNVVRFPRAGGCDVGPAQVHLNRYEGHGRWYLTGSIRVNLTVAGWLLNRSRQRCQKNPGSRVCRRCSFGYYNANSSTWCLKVLDIRRRLLRHLAPPLRSRHLAWQQGRTGTSRIE